MSARRLPTIAAAIVFASLFILLVLRVTMANTLTASMAINNPLVGDPTELFFPVVRGRVLNGDVAHLQSRTDEAAYQAPMAEEPFLVAASAALASGATNRAESLLKEALRRNPRQRQARLLLLDLYSRKQDVSSLTTEIVTLSRLLPAAGGAMSATLAQLVIEPTTRQATIRAIAGKPLIDDLLQYLVAMRADTDLILQVADVRATSASTTPSESSANWQARLIANLVEAKQYDRARSLWTRFTPGAREDAAWPLLYNPGFRDLPGAEPFNWSFAEGDVGVAERATDGSLEVVYYGRETGSLVSQLLTLAPGRYSFTATSTGTAPAEAGELTWTVSCAEGGEPLATAQISGEQATPSRVMINFSVSGTGCAAQWLRLSGQATEFPRARTVRIAAVALQRAEQ